MSLKVSYSVYLRACIHGHQPWVMPRSRALEPSTSAVVWTALPVSPFLHQVHSLRCHPRVCAGCAEALAFLALWFFWRVAHGRRLRGLPRGCKHLPLVGVDSGLFAGIFLNVMFWRCRGAPFGFSLLGRESHP